MTFENSWKLIELPLQFLYTHKEVMRPPFLSSPHKNCLWIYYGNSRRKARSVEPRLLQMSGSTMRNPTSCPTSRHSWELWWNLPWSPRKFGVSDILLPAFATSTVMQANCNPKCRTDSKLTVFVLSMYVNNK